MSSLRKVITSKMAATGFAGVLLAGGIGVAAAQTMPEAAPVLNETPSVGEAFEEVSSNLDDVQEGINTTVDDGQDAGEEGASEADNALEEGQQTVGDVEEEIDETTDEVEEATGEVENEVDEELDETTDEVEETVDDADRTDNFGARVSADARGESDGVRGVDGQQISAEARAKGEAKRSGATNAGGSITARR